MVLLPALRTGIREKSAPAPESAHTNCTGTESRTCQQDPE